jgi:hypothetical protein
LGLVACPFSYIRDKAPGGEPSALSGVHKNFRITLQAVNIPLPTCSYILIHILIFVNKYGKNNQKNIKKNNSVKNITMLNRTSIIEN